MSQSAPRDPKPLPLTSVTKDTPCRKCGYNLRGQSIDTRCPECGVAVGVSAMGDLLRYCDPIWVADLARGTRLIIAGVFAGIAAILSFGLEGPQAPAIVAIADISSNLLIVAGSWLITAPDPSGLGERRYGTARKIIRITLLVGALNAAVTWATKLAPPPAALQQTATAVGGIVRVVAVVGIFAQLQYLERLARRIPDPSLSSTAKYLKPRLAGCYSILIVGGLVADLVGGNSASQNFLLTALSYFLWLVGVAVLVFALLYVLMITRFNKRFNEQAQLASMNWAIHAGAPQAS